MNASPLVLVVEDDPDVLDGMVTLLEEEGYRALTASDGAAALEVLRGGQAVSVVLLDLTMPRMSAAEFRAVQRAEPAISKVPIILMSAGLDISRQAEVLGAVGFLGKPFSPPALLKAIEGVVPLADSRQQSA
jgi:CheY-like chemotaxis protein